MKAGKTTNLTLSTDQLEMLEQLLSQTKMAKLETSESPNTVVSFAKQGILILSLISFKFPIDC